MFFKFLYVQPVVVPHGTVGRQTILGSRAQYEKVSSLEWITKAFPGTVDHFVFVCWLLSMTGRAPHAADTTDTTIVQSINIK